MRSADASAGRTSTAAHSALATAEPIGSRVAHADVGVLRLPSAPAVVRGPLSAGSADSEARAGQQDDGAQSGLAVRS